MAKKLKKFKISYYRLSEYKRFEKTGKVPLYHIVVEAENEEQALAKARTPRRHITAVGQARKAIYPDTTLNLKELVFGAEAQTGDLAPEALSTDPEFIETEKVESIPETGDAPEYVSLRAARSSDAYLTLSIESRTQQVEATPAEDVLPEEDRFLIATAPVAQYVALLSETSGRALFVSIDPRLTQPDADELLIITKVAPQRFRLALRGVPTGVTEPIRSNAKLPRSEESKAYAIGLTEPAPNSTSDVEDSELESEEVLGLYVPTASAVEEDRNRQMGWGVTPAQKEAVEEFATTEAPYATPVEMTDPQIAEYVGEAPELKDTEDAKSADIGQCGCDWCTQPGVLADDEDEVDEEFAAHVGDLDDEVCGDPNCPECGGTEDEESDEDEASRALRGRLFHALDEAYAFGLEQGQPIGYRRGYTQGRREGYRYGYGDGLNVLPFPVTIALALSAVVLTGGAILVALGHPQGHPHRIIPFVVLMVVAVLYDAYTYFHYEQ